MNPFWLLILAFSLSACATTKNVEKQEGQNEKTSDVEVVPVMDLSKGRKEISQISKALNTLYRIDSEGCGYVNKKGDTLIPSNAYQACFTDTIKHFGAFLTHSGTFVGVNTKNEVLFEIYPFDNGPDYFSEGMIRIKLGDKIGYANEQGKVVITPKYSCAFPFEGGRAKVALKCFTQKHGEHTHVDSNEWIYIDKKGNVIAD